MSGKGGKRTLANSVRNQIDVTYCIAITMRLITRGRLGTFEVVKYARNKDKRGAR